MKPSIYLLVEEMSRALLAKHHTLAVAESCTGGMVAEAITGIPGVSRFFKGGVTAYSNEAKEKLLCIPAAVLDRYGAVSGETVTLMAENIRKELKTTCAVAVSGIAGPDGGTAKKPVGLVFISVIAGTKKHTCSHEFEGNRQQIRECATEAALRHLLELLQTKKRKV
jgi:PncC family amidohydrolase